jgi:tRNA G26 N,N-dimethylase Trm1
MTFIEEFIYNPTNDFNRDFSVRAPSSHII